MTTKMHILYMLLSLSLTGLWLAGLTALWLLMLYPESVFLHTGNARWLVWYLPMVVLALTAVIEACASSRPKAADCCRPVFHY